MQRKYKFFKFFVDMGEFLFLWAFFGAFVGLCEAEFLGVWCKFGAANLGFGFSLLYMGKFWGNLE